jgi:hypothetical protein
MTPTSNATTDDEKGTPEPEARITDAPFTDAPELEADDDDLDDLDDPEADEPAAEELLEPGAASSPTLLRRLVSVLVATAVFEVLYLVGVTIIAFATAGFAAIVPTLQSVAVSPFLWVPVAVFLVCVLVVAIPLNGARRAPAVTGLVVAVVVYLATTFFVLLVAGGSSALAVFVQELSVYPFFLAAIVAREVMVWTRFGHPRVVRATAVAAEVPAS